MHLLSPISSLLCPSTSKAKEIFAGHVCWSGTLSCANPWVCCKCPLPRWSGKNERNQSTSNILRGFVLYGHGLSIASNTSRVLLKSRWIYQLPGEDASCKMGGTCPLPCCQSSPRWMANFLLQQRLCVLVEAANQFRLDTGSHFHFIHRKEVWSLSDVVHRHADQFITAMVSSCVVCKFPG